MKTQVEPSLRKRRAPALPFDVLESKLRVPEPRPGSVSRTALVNRLRSGGAHRLVTLVAPAGYGKTTVLAQWAGRDERPFAWVTVDERDGDPVVLLRHVAAALHRIEPFGAAALEPLRVPRGPVWATAVPRLASALAARGSPCVLVLDGVSPLRSAGTVEPVLALAEHLPPGSLLVLACRSSPPPAIAALRAGGLLLELGAGPLALSRREAELLLRAEGVELEADRLDALLRETEGWAAGLSLAALALRDGETAVGAGDRSFADYFRAECLAGLTRERLAFLVRTSVLDRMCGPLCDAVLGRTGSARELEAIEAEGLFLAPLDRSRTWFRYHRLFRDLLRRELARRERGPAALHRRAADWLEAHGEAGPAVDHAAAAGDLDRVARLVASTVPPALERVGIETERRLALLADEPALERHPELGPLGAWVHALRGRAADAERWLAAAERRRARATAPLVAVVRAALCPEGAEEMEADAAAALAALPARSVWRPTALLLRGAACAILGDDARAEALLAAAGEAAQRTGAVETRVAAASERALLAAGREEYELADALAFEARALASRDEAGGGPARMLERAVATRALLRRGRWDDARAELAAAGELATLLTDALPWLAAQARLELARAHVTLRDADAAGALLAEVEPILRRRPRLGTLPEQARRLAAEIDALRSLRVGRRSTLTAAELRLLPLLATHLSFREIGDRLRVSRNTIKTQAVSVYRKLGVSSRSDAIAEAARLGLVGSPPPGDAAA